MGYAWVRLDNYLDMNALSGGFPNKRSLCTESSLPGFITDLCLAAWGSKHV